MSIYGFTRKEKTEQREKRQNKVDSDVKEKMRIVDPDNEMYIKGRRHYHEKKSLDEATIEERTNEHFIRGYNDVKRTLEEATKRNIGKQWFLAEKSYEDLENEYKNDVEFEYIKEGYMSAKNKADAEMVGRGWYLLGKTIEELPEKYKNNSHVINAYNAARKEAEDKAKRQARQQESAHRRH